MTIIKNIQIHSLFKIYIILLYFATPVFGQKNQYKIAIQKDISIDSLIKYNNTIGNMLAYRNDSLILTGKKLEDTLYIYIANKKEIDTITCHYMNLNKKLNAYNMQLVNNGDLFAKLQPVKLKVIKNRLFIRYKVIASKPRRIDDINYSANDFPKNIKKYLFNRHGGRAMDKKNITAIKRIIENETDFHTGKTKILFDNNKSILFFDLQKPKTNSISGILGFSYDQADEKLQVEGEINTKLYNLMHYNESLSVRWRKKDLRQNFQLALNTPHLFAKNIFAKNTLLIERKDSTKLNLFYQLSVGAQFSKHHISLHYIIDNQIGIQPVKENLYGFAYQYQIDNKVGLFGDNSLMASMSIGAEQKSIIDVNFRYQTPVFSRFYLASEWHLFNIHGLTHSNLLKTYQNTERNSIMEQNNLQRFNTLKLSYAYKNNRTYYYIITDFTASKVLMKNEQKLANIGVGLKLYSKSQILTFEITKSLDLFQNTAYQPFTISIRQQIKF